VFLLNPIIAVATLGVVDLPTIISSAANILSVVGERAAGSWLRLLVSIDAIMVLSGGVLTAYVGVAGLIKQLATDRCFPSILLETNSLTGTNHYIILGFFLLCTFLYVVTGGNVIVVSGVFAIAFLMVLLSFAWANIKLKFCRPRLPRGCISSWFEVILGFAVMLLGMIGNIVYNYDLALYFLIFMTFYLGVITASFNRSRIVVFLLYLVRQVPYLEKKFANKICNLLVSMKDHTAMFFAKTSELHILNKAILYTRDNELIDRLIICHVHEQSSGSHLVGERLKENLLLLDHMYPKIKMDLLLVEAEEFNPNLIAMLAKDLKILPSFMFIRCPGKSFKYNIAEYEGIRTIMR